MTLAHPSWHSNSLTLDHWHLTRHPSPGWDICHLNDPILHQSFLLQALFCYWQKALMDNETSFSWVRHWSFKFWVLPALLLFWTQSVRHLRHLPIISSQHTIFLGVTFVPFIAWLLHQLCFPCSYFDLISYCLPHSQFYIGYCWI